MPDQIIIIDQDRDFAEALSQRLKVCGFITAGISHSSAFFQLATKMNPALILISDNLQNPTWSELLGRVKHSSLDKLAPFVLIYTDRSPAIRQQARLYGINKMIQKPLRFIELLYLIKDELKGKKI